MLQFGAKWGSVQSDGIWSPQGPLQVQFWDILGVQFRLTGDGSHRPHMFSALGHFVVQFRLMDSGLLRTKWGFSFGAL